LLLNNEPIETEEPASPPERRIHMSKAKEFTQLEKMIDVAKLLRSKRDEIYTLWMQQQMDGGALRLDLMSQDDLEDQSREFIDAFFNALLSGKVDDITGVEYEEVREMLIEVSRTRAIQGFSPSETATFVFSLKDACMEFLQREFESDVDLLRISLTGISQAVDKLGLQTFEAFSNAREALAREQADTILSMATPVTSLWDDVLLLPIVGTIDSNRAQDIMEVMLNKIQTTEAKVILLDILGVASVDSAVAQHLIKITKATQLMGCRCIITGISSEIAQALVHLGLDLGDVQTSSTLRSGLVYAFESLELKVVSKNA